jgi:hypothetical protein
MDMGMMLQGLSPGMQDTEKADLCTEMFRIGSGFQQRFGTGAEQQVIEEALFCRMSAESACGRVKTT